MKATINESSREGWILILGLAVVLCVSFGSTLNSISVFTLPITESFRCTNEQAGLIATVFLFTMTLAMPLTGWLLDRIAPRPIMTAGAMLTALGYLLAARSPDISMLTIAMAISGIGVGASTYVPAITLATHWIPPGRQGLAIGILLSGASLGAVIFPILLTHISAEFGWRSAMLIVAAMILLICVPLLLWLARKPETGSETHLCPVEQERLGGHDIGHALRMPRYWLWIVMLMLTTLSSLGVYIAVVPLLVAAGYTAQHAAAFYAGIGAATFIGSFVFGALSQRWGAKTILLIGTAIGSVGILCLLAARNPALSLGAVTLFAVIWGSTFNLPNQLSPLLLVETMGQRNFGTLLGIGNLVSGVGAALSPEMVGYLVDTTHTYTYALLLLAALMAAALLPMALLQGPSLVTRVQ
ncbi:MFS transporter [Cupriavidus basilensis]